MVDACGLAINLGVLGAGLAVLGSGFSALSAFYKDPVTRSGVVGTRNWQWPSYSNSALISSSCAAALSFLSAMAYSGERPDTPNKFLRDYDTKGANRTWALGQGWYMMLAGFFIMVGSIVIIVTVSLMEPPKP